MFVYIRSAAFVIVFTQKLVLQQSKNVTAKCTETLSPPPSIQFSLQQNMWLFILLTDLTGAVEGVFKQKTQEKSKYLTILYTNLSENSII